MRVFLYKLLILLLAGCVWLQSTASAMGVNCAHGESSDASISEPMAGAGHAHHHSPGPADASASDGTHALDMFGCQCGCTCSHAGCMSIASDITPPAGAASFGAPRVTLRAALLSSRVQPAHALDLIRPPSIS